MDTWFLCGLAEEREDCITLFEQEEGFVVSTLPIFEVIRKCLKEGRPESANKVVEICKQLARIMPVNLHIAEKAALYLVG